MEKIRQIIKDWFTARNGVDYSLTKLAFIAASSTMIYKFGISDVPDYVGFAGGYTAMLAAMGYKYSVESKPDA